MTPDASADASASLLVVNANVITMDDERPTAEAVLMVNGRVSKVGSSAELRPTAAGVTVLDVGGATVLPGFIDGHTHF